MWMLQEFEYKKQTVMLAPGSGFYFNTDLGKQEVRIAYVLNLEDLKNAMACLRAGLAAYPGRTVMSDE
jgi:aspartate aminotransferase